MKISLRAIIAAAVVTGLISLPVSAQAPVETPAPVQTKGATRPAAKRSVARAAKSEPVFTAEPGAARQNNINVRGQATLNSEVIAHLKKGDPVIILQEVTVKKPKQDEPARWYRISLPSDVQVWVHSSFVDTNASTVKANKLNMRGGPGENYSIVGRLEKGASVKTVATKDEWLKIETPTNAFGFVAAHLIEKTPAPPVVPKPPEIVVAPPTTETVATNVPTTVATDVNVPVVPPPTTPAETVTPPVITPAPVESVTEAPIEKVRKVVSREGILKGSVSIQAPTYFELRSLDTGRTIDYVFSPTTNLMLKEFKGQRVIVTGEEVLDERWQNTPVLVLDDLQAVR